jgi:hypothetical protein
MTSLRDPRRYREQAAHFRELAAAITDGRELRDSYLALSLQYERLARILEKTAAPTVGETQQPSVYSGNGRQARSRGAHIEPEPQRGGCHDAALREYRRVCPDAPADQFAASRDVNRMVAAAINADTKWFWHGRMFDGR